MFEASWPLGFAPVDSGKSGASKGLPSPTLHSKTVDLIEPTDFRIYSGSGNMNVTHNMQMNSSKHHVTKLYYITVGLCILSLKSIKHTGHV